MPGNRLPPSPVLSPRPPSRDSVPVRPRERAQPLRAPPAFGIPEARPEPPAAGLTEPSARSRSGHRLPEVFPVEPELCNRIVKDHGSGRKCERPHKSTGGRSAFTARSTLTPRISGRGMRGFRTLECGKDKTLPTHAHHHLRTAGVGTAGPLASDLSVPHGVRSGVVFPSIGEKQGLKPLYHCGLAKPINAIQAAAAKGSSEVRINATEANCSPRRRDASRRKPYSAPIPIPTPLVPG